MPRVAVDPPGYLAGSTVFGCDIAIGLWNAVADLGGALAGSGGMAGTDPAGAAWSDAYDAAAADATGVTQDVLNGCYQLAGLLAATGFNHASANLASTPGAGMVADPTDYSAASAVFDPPPSALGGPAGGLGAPAGWSLIAHLVEAVWPNGHQDRLQAAGAGWASAADAISTAGWVVDSAVASVEAQVSPEVPDAVTACSAMGGHIADLADAHRALGAACSDYAAHLNEAHSEAICELSSLVKWTAGIEAGGALLGLFSFGAGEAAAQVAEAARVAATAARVSAILARLADLVETVVAAISAATARVVEISARLRPLLGARISRVAAEAVKDRGAVSFGKDAEEVAIDGLEAEAAMSENDRAAIDYATTPAKLDHIFASKHRFELLVDQLGGRPAVVRAFVLGLRGRVPASGTFEVRLVIGSQLVVVRGAVVNGVIKIGTAFTP